jgi:hypothetical protein
VHTVVDENDIEFNIRNPATSADAARSQRDHKSQVLLDFFGIGFSGIK